MPMFSFPQLHFKPIKGVLFKIIDQTQAHLLNVDVLLVVDDKQVTVAQTGFVV